MNAHTLPGKTHPSFKGELNAYEDKVLRYAYADNEATSDSFPGENRNLIIAAFDSLHQKGYVEALVLPSNGNSPLPVWATILRVLPKGVFYCEGVE